MNCIETNIKTNSRDWNRRSAVPRRTDRDGFRRPAISRPVTPKPLTPKDRQYLRALRAAEMSLWLEIQKTAAEECPPQPKASVGELFGKLSTGHQKRELGMLLILTAAAVTAVTVAFLQSGSFVQSWAEFVQNVSSF